jgi:hypothetical protein
VPALYIILTVPTFATRCLSMSCMTWELQAAKVGTICGLETWPVILPRDADFHNTFWGSLTCRKYTTWDRRLYFPSEGRRAEDFFALKNPTALAGFEPANLGTKGQHATHRPPKPLVCLRKDVSIHNILWAIRQI